MKYWRMPRTIMVIALLFSTAFLGCYLYYHYHAGHVRFAGTGLTRPVYFFILFTHIPLAILTVLGLTGLALSAALFRWEGTEPISKRSVAIILGAFVVVMLLAAVVAPAFRMNELPGSRSIEAGDALGKVRVLRGATVLDGLGGRIDNARVVIRDHKVAEVSIDRAEDLLPAGAETEDLTGKFLIPGLFDSSAASRAK